MDTNYQLNNRVTVVFFPFLGGVCRAVIFYLVHQCMVVHVCVYEHSCVKILEFLNHRSEREEGYSKSHAENHSSVLRKHSGVDLT